MPLFSIIIPSYNNAEYLPKCIASLQRQKYESWEAIIVVDGSPDNAAQVASRLADADCRVKVINKERNEGTHLARKTGVAAATGQYILFLDADDELTIDAFDKLREAIGGRHIDVLHFGTELFGEEMPETVCAQTLSHLNAEFPTLYDEHIPEVSFVQDDSCRQDWRVLQRVYDVNLVKRAFDLTTDKRLGRGQDSYEWLVISSQAHEELVRNDIIAYRYYLGRGITTLKPLTRSGFADLTKSYHALLEAATQYAREFRRYDLAPCVEGMKAKIIRMLVDDWKVRVADEDKIPCAECMAAFMDPVAVAAEIMRLVRDAAYEIWDKGNVLSEHESFLAWFDCAEQMVRNTPEQSNSFKEFHSAAAGHIRDLRSRKAQQNRTVMQVLSNRVRLLVHQLRVLVFPHGNG